MARLPIPGSDSGTWGQVLNDYLSQTHKADGTLKDSIVSAGALAPNAVTASSLQSGSVAGDKLQDGSITPAKLVSDTPVSGDVLSYNGSGFEWVAPQAGSGEVNTASNVGTGGVGVYWQKSGVNLEFKQIRPGSNKVTVTDNIGNSTVDVDVSTANLGLTKSDVGLGNVDNTSDLNKPVSTATQSALNTKASTTHAHTAADVTSGTLDIARIPTGSTNTTVSLGNHAHTGVYLPIKGGTSALTDSTNDRFARVDISDDTSPSSGWPDRFAFYFTGTRTGYHNEYGELRARPAKASTVALRAMYFGSGSANIFEVAPSAAGVEYFAVSSTAASLTVPLSSTRDITTTGTVTGSNIGAKVTASSTAPASPATGDVWIDLSA